MSSYFALKAIHIISAAVLFGTGLGIAYFKWTTDRTGNTVAIRVVSEKVVLADWLFTLPAIVVQALTGLALARSLGSPPLARLAGLVNCALLPRRAVLGSSRRVADSDEGSRVHVGARRSPDNAWLSSLRASMVLAWDSRVCVGGPGVLDHGCEASGLNAASATARW